MIVSPSNSTTYEYENHNSISCVVKFPVSTGHFSSSGLSIFSISQSQYTSGSSLHRNKQVYEQIKCALNERFRFDFFFSFYFVCKNSTHAHPLSNIFVLLRSQVLAVDFKLKLAMKLSHRTLHQMKWIQIVRQVKQNAKQPNERIKKKKQIINEEVKWIWKNVNTITQ